MTVAMSRKQWRCAINVLGIAFLFIASGCANHIVPTVEPAWTPTPQPTSTPRFFWIQELPSEPLTVTTAASDQPEIRKRVYMLAEAIGRLEIINQCLRLNSSSSDTSYLLVWPSLFTLDQDFILDQFGRQVARIGQEICISGGEIPNPAQWNQRQIIPSECEGPYWAVGLQVRPNIHQSSELIAVELVSSPDAEIIHIQSKPALDHWTAIYESVTGRLLLLSRCLYIIPDDNSPGYAIIWPMGYQIDIQGLIRVIDQNGQNIAHVGQSITLTGKPINGVWQGYSQLADAMPCDCQPPYWVVR